MTVVSDWHVAAVSILCQDTAAHRKETVHDINTSKQFEHFNPKNYCC